VTGRNEPAAASIEINGAFASLLWGSKRMHRINWLLPALCLVFLFGCASRQRPETIKSPAEASQTEKQKKPAPTPSVPKATIRSVKSADGLIDGEIVGTPTSGSKFAKLQIGMTQAQVEKLIGKPNGTDSRITGKQFQPFHFGGDTQRTEAFYENEGQLTYSNMLPDSAADTLIRIKVNPKTTGNR
jgi:hypothetical protein